VETFFGLVHQKLDNQPNISYVRKFFSSVHGFPGTAFSNSTLPAQASRAKPYRQHNHRAK